MASAGATGHSTVTPSCNRLLQKKWNDKKFQAHKDRVRWSMSATMSLNIPVCQHLLVVNTIRAGIKFECFK